MILKPKNLTLSLPAIIIWNTKAREINDSIVFSIDYYSTLRNCLKWFTEYCMLVEMLVMLEKSDQP
jgi:hypothetical protein